MSWKPGDRPEWLRRLIAHGPAVGGARHLVSLDPDELLATAAASTGGLEVFGDGGDADGDGRAWLARLVRALEDEARLHAAGRLVARQELLRSLRNRLQLAALWKRHPEWLDAPLLPPSFVVGMARSGTSILSELLALDPAARCPAMWEMLHPAESLVGEGLRAVGDAETVFMADLAPEYAAMHENSGDLPNECIYVTINTFVSDHWSGCHVVPSYERELPRADHVAVYRYHERVLKTLQQRGARGRTRWGLKAPSHLPQLEALFTAYPDARVIRIHRDPLKSIPSTVNLMGTLKHMRCDDVSVDGAGPALAHGYALMLRYEIEKRRDGRIPADRIVDVRYHDLMHDLAGTIRSVYERCGWELDERLLARMRDYVAARPRGAHRYSLEAAGLDREQERERFRFYCEHYGVPPEE